MVYGRRAEEEFLLEGMTFEDAVAEVSFDPIRLHKCRRCGRSWRYTQGLREGDVHTCWTGTAFHDKLCRRRVPPGDRKLLAAHASMWMSL